MGISVKGLKETRRAIRKLPANLREAIWEEEKAGARQMRKDIRANARKRTGTLRRSIKTVLRKRELFASVVIGKEGWYWFLLERGTSKMPPKPFVRPVWDAAKDDLRRKLDDTIRKEVNKPR